MTAPPPRRLPRRDLLLLPLVSLVTIAALFVLAEINARTAYTEHELDSCIVPDPRLGLRYRPDCHSATKSFESDWVQNSYNACGYRSDAPCGPAPPNSLRVAVMGSSMALGFLVPQAETFPAVASRDLTEACGRPVEFQNLAGFLIFWTRVAARVPDVIKLKPNAVVLEPTPFDLERPDPGPGAYDPANDDAETNGAAETRQRPSLLIRLKTLVDQSRALQVAQHFLLRDDSLYVPLYLRSGAKSAYMRQPLTPFWQAQLAQYDAMLGRMADAFHASEIPMVLAFVPQRAQASLAALQPPPAGVDPELLNRMLKSMAARHGIGFIDATPGFTHGQPTHDLFYPINAHLNGAGQAIVAHEVTSGILVEVPAFAGCDRAKSLQMTKAR